MKTLIASLIAALAAVSTLHAHCGSCGIGDEEHDHADAHEACSDAALTGYFAIQKALASDDLAAAKTAATTLHSHADGTKCPLGDESCCAGVSTNLEAITSAKDLASARATFSELSKSMIAQLEAHGTETAAYQMHCPMAFKGKGAAWLQDSEELRNPYYGAAMLKCGTPKTSYGAAHDH